jgi:protein-tyrosine phosphatase
MSHNLNPHRTVLFLCTGNYYRSRFAEHLFNHLARQRNLCWRAISRALSNETGSWKVGPISRFALAGLQARGIRSDEPHREPVYCHEPDLCNADMVIALKETEHRPLVSRRFPDWPDRIEYWHIHDIDQALPEDALAELEQLVDNLIARLAENTATSSRTVR